MICYKTEMYKRKEIPKLVDIDLLHVTCMAYVHLNAYACIDRRIKRVRGVFRLRKKTNKQTV